MVVPLTEKVWGRYWEVRCQVFIFGQIEFERTIRHTYVLEGFRKPRHIKWWIVLLIFFYHSRKAVVKILAFGKRQTWVSTFVFLIKHAILDNYPLWVLVFKVGKYLLHWTFWKIKLECVCEIPHGVLVWIIVNVQQRCPKLLILMVVMINWLKAQMQWGTSLVERERVVSTELKIASSLFLSKQCLPRPPTPMLRFLLSQVSWGPTLFPKLAYCVGIICSPDHE